MRPCAQCPNFIPQCTKCPQGTECAISIQTCDECATTFCRPLKSSPKFLISNFKEKNIIERPASSIPWRIIVGCIVGGVLGLALISILIFCLLSRANRQKRQSHTNKKANVPTNNQDEAEMSNLTLQRSQRANNSKIQVEPVSPIYYRPRPVPSSPRRAPKIPQSPALPSESPRYEEKLNRSPPSKPRSPSSQVRLTLNTFRSAYTNDIPASSRAGRYSIGTDIATSNEELGQSPLEGAQYTSSENDRAHNLKYNGSPQHFEVASSAPTGESQTVLDIYDSYTERPSSSVYID